MVQTITTDFQFVTDGETTVENPGSIVGNENIIISNAEIQWQGTTETSSSTSYSTNTNSGSATATSSTSTDYKSNENFYTGTIVNEPNGTYPSVPSGYTFDRGDWKLVTVVTLSGDIETTVSANVEGTIYNDTISNTSGTNGYTITFTGQYSSSDVGTATSIGMSASSDFSGGGEIEDDFVELTLTTRGKDTTTTVNSNTTTVSYPSVPSGHSFDRHYYREEKNGSFVDSDYIYTNKVGDTRSVTSNDPSNTWELTMQTRGEQTVTTTTETQDPSVSGDVSAAYNGTLGSQEYSSWQPLSGFELGDNSFVHDIGGTNEAFYQIRFEYELSFPTTVAEAYIHVGNTTYPVILADPSDPNLVYDFYRVNHPTHGELAFDVVNTTNADATPYTVTDGNGNVRALRENTQ